jgi:aromatic ring-cleaving dioxygenase
MPENLIPDPPAAPAATAPRDSAIVRHYHAHVYYDPASSRDRAARLREAVATAFPDATLGRWHDAPVGPHPQSMYQIAFSPALLGSLLPWLMLNRDGLTILLHPGTEDAVADHTEHAAWLGGMLPLRLDALRASQADPGRAPAQSGA